MELFLIDTKSLNQSTNRDTKIEACHQRMADCDDLAVCSELVLNFEKYEYFV